MSHSYSTDSLERRYVPFGLAAAAIAASFLVARIVDMYSLSFPWWASPPVDTMAFYGLFYWLFDRYLWKWKIFRVLHIVRIPDLSGTWQGHVVPTDTGGISAGLAKPAGIEVKIKQTWATLFISGHTTNSRFHSIVGAITVAEQVSLNYQYINEPSAGAAPTMHTHRGTVNLLFDGSKSLAGDYYSGRDRQNIGALQITRL